MRRNFLFTVFIILPILLANVPASSANFSVSIDITDAYYADLDADLLEDDIVVTLNVTLTNIYVSTNVDIYIGITLPSGTEFWFLAEINVVKYTYSVTFGMKFDLMNTALEPGWYEANAVGFADGDQFSIMDSFIFDPPGGTDGGWPTSVYEIIIY